MTAHTPALDGVRGLAILLVLLHHFTIFEPATRLGAGLKFAGLLGWSGVDVFFVLSGFLITGILIDARGGDRYFTSFYARRVLRIFPLYYLTVIVSFLVLPQFPRAYALLVGDAQVAQWPYWTYLVNVAIAGRDAFRHGVLDVAWSLAIEEQFYFVWPAIVWILPPRAIGWVCAAIVVGVPALRWSAMAAGATPVDIYVLPHLRADALAMGGLMAWAARAGWLARWPWGGPAAAVAGLAGAVALAITAGSPWWWEPLTQRAGYTLFALGGAGLVWAAVVQPDTSLWQRALRMSWLRACGKYSYAMYLIHLPVSRTIQEFVIGRDQFPMWLGDRWLAQCGFYLLATAPTFALAWLSWRIFEAPILRLKHRFPY